MTFFPLFDLTSHSRLNLSANCFDINSTSSSVKLWVFKTIPLFLEFKL